MPRRTVPAADTNRRHAHACTRHNTSYSAWHGNPTAAITAAAAAATAAATNAEATTSTAAAPPPKPSHQYKQGSSHFKHQHTP
jgi:hypothetical protein